MTTKITIITETREPIGDTIDLTRDIVVRCPKHGEFVVNAQAHLDGKGCPQCSKPNYTRAYYIDPGRGESDDILIVDNWNDFGSWIEFVIEELEMEKRRRQIWDDCVEKYEKEKSEHWDDYEWYREHIGGAEGEFSEIMTEMGWDSSTTFFDTLVLVDVESVVDDDGDEWEKKNETIYTVYELRDIAKRMWLKL